MINLFPILLLLILILFSYLRSGLSQRAIRHHERSLAWALHSGRFRDALFLADSVASMLVSEGPGGYSYLESIVVNQSFGHSAEIWHLASYVLDSFRGRHIQY